MMMSLSDDTITKRPSREQNLFLRLCLGSFVELLNVEKTKSMILIGIKPMHNISKETCQENDNRKLSLVQT